MKNTPERIYHSTRPNEIDLLKSFAKRIDTTDAEYIRKDISDEKCEESETKGFQNGIKAQVEGSYTEDECEERERIAYDKGAADMRDSFNITEWFTKEQVVKLIKKGMTLKSLDIFNELPDMDETWIENYIINPSTQNKAM